MAPDPEENLSAQTVPTSSKSIVPDSGAAPTGVDPSKQVAESPINGDKSTLLGSDSTNGTTNGTTNGHSKEINANSHKEVSAQSQPKAPLKLKGVLDQFQSFDVTPVIGREFQNVDLTEWLRAPNSDELIRDLAITGEPPSIEGGFKSLC